MTAPTLWAVATAVAGVALVLAGCALWTRWHLQQTPGVFACRVSPAGVNEPRGRRRRRHARWVHVVLILPRGPTLTRTEVLPVATVGGPAPATPVRGLGPDPVRLRVHLDDERQVELLVADADVPAAFGPFVVASLTWRKRTGAG
jgi:hypothetical protein